MTSDPPAADPPAADPPAADPPPVRRIRTTFRSTVRTTLRTTLGLAAAVVCLAACGGGSPAAPASTAPGGTSGTSLAVLGHQWAQCLRQHGVTNLPDPTISDGALGFAGQSKRLITPAALEACQSIAARIPGLNTPQAPTHAQFQRMLAFSACMRVHGLSDWPDPHSDGTFPLPGDITQRGKLGIRSQLQACHRFYGGSIDVTNSGQPGTSP
jgi:hypothetical protein